ncbi:MAG: hypothetical protein V3R33_04400 [Anaerolineales bacterium]
MTDIKATIINRDINPYHSLLSSFLAGLAELGLVNQGSMNIVSKRAADYLYEYLDANEILPDMKAVPGDTVTEVVKNLMLYINNIISLMGEFDLQEVDGDRAVLLIAEDKCRICPKSVGSAEVKGTLCPIPSFLDGLVNNIAGEELITLVKTGIEKEDTTCKVIYQLKS